MVKIIGKDYAQNNEEELIEIVKYYNEVLFDGRSKVNNIIWNNRTTRTVGSYTYSTKTIELSKKHHQINDYRELSNTIER